LEYFETRFFLVPGTGTVYVDSKLSVIRQRAVAEGFREDLTILNHDDEPVELTIRVDVGSDFADLFEVKDALAKKGPYKADVEDGQLVLKYERKNFGRATVISSSAPAQIDKNGLTFEARIEPHGAWETRLEVIATALEGGELQEEHGGYVRVRRREGMAANLDHWLADAPRVECDWESLKATYRRRLVDLAA